MSTCLSTKAFDFFLGHGEEFLLLYFLSFLNNARSLPQGGVTAFAGDSEWYIQTCGVFLKIGVNPGKKETKDGSFFSPSCF